MPDLRSPHAKARDAWLDSTEGQNLSRTSRDILGKPVPLEDQYVKNRVEAAFSAGWNAAVRLIALDILRDVKKKISALSVILVLFLVGCRSDPQYTAEDIALPVVKPTTYAVHLYENGKLLDSWTCVSVPTLVRSYTFEFTNLFNPACPQKTTVWCGNPTFVIEENK